MEAPGLPGEAGQAIGTLWGRISEWTCLQSHRPLDYIASGLTPDEVKGGYLGYANQVLWPLCHITLDRINGLASWQEQGLKVRMMSSMQHAVG